LSAEALDARDTSSESQSPRKHLAVLMRGFFVFRLLVRENSKETRTMNEGPSSPPLFKGFPYLLSHLNGELYHIILLPRTAEQQDPQQFKTAHDQAWANHLPTWLVTSEHEAWLFGYAMYLPSVVQSHVPRPSAIAFGKLVTQEAIPETGEIITRYLTLCLHANHVNGGGSTIYVGDLTKGGRPANGWQIDQLSGRQPNGVPKGLQQCATCREWRGTCLDTNIPDLLVNVSCSCYNANRCARCGQPLYNRMLKSNYYSEKDGGIWHVPGFCAIDHKCPQAVESWVTQPFIALRTAGTIQ